MKLRARRSEPHLPIEEVGPAFAADGQFARPVADWSELPEEQLLAAETRQLLQQAIAARLRASQEGRADPGEPASTDLGVQELAGPL